MYFIIDCDDSDAGLALRPEHRSAHLAHLARVRESILTAGPKLNGAGEPCGSLLVIDFVDRAAAEAFAREDPYAQAGVFAKVTVMPYRQTLPHEATGRGE
ncbi:MAG: YciI family protein [Alphaproteobacteria bacterium GM202ARS2]|nr:YciI family protein [Alphaproteobacteria bacterium GM202ARS2]